MLYRTSCAAIVLLGVAGCAHRPVVVKRSELQRRAPELRERGSARLRALGGEVHEVPAGRVVTVEVESGPRGPLVPRRVTLDRLLAGCGGEGRGRDCLLERVTDREIVVGRRRVVDYRAITRGIGGVAGAGLLGYCAVSCDDPAEVLAVAGGVVLYVFATEAVLWFR